MKNPTKKQIEEYLKKIKWSLKHHGCEHYYFYNHKNECTGLSLNGDKIESRDEKSMPIYVFYLKDKLVK